MISTEQAPGIYRHRIGDVLVTVLHDGELTISPSFLQNTTAAEVEALMRAAGRRPPFNTAVNVFLLQWPGRTVLVDTGYGGFGGPTAGRLLRNLQEAGVSTADIDAVLLTHIHSDHAGGLIDADGLAVFAEAELVVPEVEIAFWYDDANMAALPEFRHRGFKFARQTTAPYADRTRRFTGTEPLPGIEAIPLPGHTPGHTGYFVGTGADRLLIWGDIFHVPDVQAARPEVTLPYDLDPARAAKTRLEILERAVAEDMLVAGMHMHFPGLGRIARAGAGFVVQPQVWSSELPPG
ncbi:MBL fold metallo-hydrolase [Acidisphaera sp. L21]|jgi:glyoxylase-like metal-dependent hydrolase (beta-lactamase superfamily II)|uniref:MBL fold metallo-hydrolase n=1 Tax=Acidisphaera sp. L21 TaxID=1641851 RepID=UPI00131A817E|nr:MBL fold metallo-hydrolase [Acidisphaera sp. L21]